MAFAVPVFLSIHPLGGEQLAPGALAAAVAAPLASAPVGDVLGGLEGAPLNRVLGQTARLQIAHGLLLALGVLLWPAQ